MFTSAGWGLVWFVVIMLAGVFSICYVDRTNGYVACRRCHGNGEVYDHVTRSGFTCGVCRGSGRVRR